MDERISKYFQDELTKSERVKLLQEAVHDDKLKEQIIEYQNIHTLSGMAPQGANKDTGRQSLQLFMEKQRRTVRRKYLIKSMGYAAAVAALVVTVWITAVNYAGIPENYIAEQQEFFVPAGQRARLKLPDGTFVWLNAGSTLTYPSVFGKERKVYLQGEGFFDVAKNQDSPFIVSAGSLNIRALGTQFNVFCYPNVEMISTSLIEGAVKVYRPEDEVNGIVLEPNQQLIYNQKSFQMLRMQNKDDLLWKEGIYNFKSERLEEILKKLDLYYDVKIIVKSPEILSYRYTGKFRQRDGVAEILRIIQKIHHFKISENEERSIITLYRE